MMTIWAIVAMLLSVAVIGWVYLMIAAQKHEVEEKLRLREEYERVRKSLKEALCNHPSDILLHASLKERIDRLREQIEK